LALYFFLRNSNQEWLAFLESPWHPIKTNFFIFSIGGPNFEKKSEKVVKNQLSRPLFDRRCTYGVTLGDWIFEGLPMGHFKKFKVFWKLDWKV